MSPRSASDSGSATRSVSMNMPSSTIGALFTRRAPSRHAAPAVMPGSITWI